MTITIAQVLAKIDHELAWRGPNGHGMGHVVLSREYAEYLRQWTITLCQERDELVHKLEQSREQSREL